MTQPETTHRSPWPWAIALSLLVVVAINIGFAVVASSVSANDGVVDSYKQEHR